MLLHADEGADEQTKEAVYKFMAYWLSDDVLKSGRTGTASRYGLLLVLEDADIQNNEIF